MKYLKTHKKMGVAGLALAVALLGGGAAYAFFTSAGGGTGSATVGTASNVTIHQDGETVYDSTIAPQLPNSPSLGYDATGVYELGTDITPVTSTSDLNTVVVDMSSWACESGAWTSGCTTSTPGSTYPATITLNIFASSGSNSAPLATDTQTFNIPFRPTSNCPTDNTAWLDTANNTCYHGLLTPITFNFSSQDFVLPHDFVYGIEYNTGDYGTAPLGDPTPVNSLNVALSTESTDVSVGQDTDPGNDFAAGVCPGGDWAPGEVTSSNCSTGFNSYPTSGGFGSTDNIPAVQFNVVNPGVPALYPAGPAQPISFTISNSGNTPAHVGSVTVSVATNPATGDIESTPGDVNTDVAGCNAGWFAFNDNPVTENTNVAPGNTDFPSSSTGLSIYMGDSGTNQDACEGASVGLVFASS
jgi:hypothetical protein